MPASTVTSQWATQEYPRRKDRRRRWKKVTTITHQSSVQGLTDSLRRGELIATQPRTVFTIQLMRTGNSSFHLSLTSGFIRRDNLCTAAKKDCEPGWRLSFEAYIRTRLAIVDLTILR